MRKMFSEEQFKKVIGFKLFKSPTQIDQDGRNLFLDQDVVNELYDWLENKEYTNEVCFIIYYDVDQGEYGLGYVQPDTSGDIYFKAGSQFDLHREIFMGNKIVYFE